MKKKVSIFSKPIAVPIRTPEKEPDISEAHRALLQWEANVDATNFDYDYIYNYPDGHEYAVVILKLPDILKGHDILGHTAEIQFTYKKMFPYRFLWDGQEVFIADKLREVNTWLNKKQKENENASKLETS